MFTAQEIAYLGSQRLARLSTVSPDGQPDVAVVAYRFVDGAFRIHGTRMARTLKYLNVRKGNPRVSLVVDDIPGGAGPGEGKARGIKIHGSAAIEEVDGAPWLVVTPLSLWSWGIEAASWEGGVEGGRSGMRRA